MSAYRAAVRAQLAASADFRASLERADAVAEYERTAARAVSMGEGARVTTLPLKRYSATEINHAARNLAEALDRVAAGVPGYVKVAALEPATP